MKGYLMTKVIFTKVGRDYFIPLDVFTDKEGMEKYMDTLSADIPMTYDCQEPWVFNYVPVDIHDAIKDNRTVDQKMIDIKEALTEYSKKYVEEDIKDDMSEIYTDSLNRLFYDNRLRCEVNENKEVTYYYCEEKVLILDNGEVIENSIVKALQYIPLYCLVHETNEVDLKLFDEFLTVNKFDIGSVHLCI